MTMPDAQDAALAALQEKLKCAQLRIVCAGTEEIFAGQRAICASRLIPRYLTRVA